MDSLLYGAEIPGHGRVSFERYGVPLCIQLDVQSRQLGTVQCSLWQPPLQIDPEHIPAVAKIMEDRKPLYARFQRDMDTLFITLLALASVGMAAIAMALGSNADLICTLIGEAGIMGYLVERRRRQPSARDIFGPGDDAFSELALSILLFAVGIVACITLDKNAVSTAVTCFIAATMTVFSAAMTPFSKNPIMVELGVMAGAISSVCWIMIAAFSGSWSLLNGSSCWAAFVLIGTHACQCKFIPRRRCAALVVWDAVRARCDRKKRE